MMQKMLSVYNKKTLSIVVLISASIFYISCEDEQYPDDIWDQNDTGNPTPVITSVDPPDSAFAGADEITINGQYFSSSTNEILVYFNSELGDILQASETSIVVSPPNIVADSIEIKVAIQGAFLFGVYENYYTLYPRIVKYGNFDPFEESVWGLETDNDENLYVGLSIFPEGTIEKLSPPDAERDSSFINAVLATPLSIRIGPDNQIYYVDGSNPYIIKHDLTTGEPSYNTLPGIAADLDFDENGNLYCGGSGKEIYLVLTDLTSTVVADYMDINIKAIRVYNNYVYVAGNYLGTSLDIPAAGIWRNQILSSSGSLGDMELVLDWVEMSGSNSNITCLTFDENGKMYISTDNNFGIATYDLDGNFITLYPKIISAPITKMTWGAGNYLYLNYRGDPRAIYRLIMYEQGAPYYGRP